MAFEYYTFINLNVFVPIRCNNNNSEFCHNKTTLALTKIQLIRSGKTVNNEYLSLICDFLETFYSINLLKMI